MKKMSMTHESCHPGMVPTFKGNHDQVLSLFVDMLELLTEDKTTLIVVNEMKDSYFKSYLQSNHVLMFSILPIRNTKGGQIGCISCHDDVAAATGPDNGVVAKKNGGVILSSASPPNCKRRT